MTNYYSILQLSKTEEPKMNILSKAKTTFDTEIEKIARANIIEKLYKQDIDHLKLSDLDFDALVEAEKEILESDTKKVGLGIAIGLGVSMLTGI